jgi:HPt (histidine-containing phosphotransfer) domain-containing protein
MSSQFDDKVDQIRNRFVQRTAGDLNRLQSLMALLETSDPGPAIDAIRRMGHSLAGAAGTFGYSDLAAAADAVEMEAAAVQRSGQSDMLALQECCKRLLSEVQFLVGPPAGEQHKP